MMNHGWKGSAREAEAKEKLGDFVLVIGVEEGHLFTNGFQSHRWANKRLRTR
jgi:hypothetical protein